MSAGQIQNLTPLAGIKLIEVDLPPQVTKGIEVLRPMKSLLKINRQPASEFLKKWDTANVKSK
jgi:hypothetical protein